MGGEKDVGMTKIEKSLVDQLRGKGADVEHFRQLIKDYIWMHKMVQSMKKSIQVDGEMIQATSASGKEYMKENPAVKNVILYSRQMLAILREMGLDTESTGEDEDDGL